MMLRFVKCLGAGDGATVDIGLARSVARRGGVRIGFALGVLHCIGRQLVMEQPPKDCGAVRPLSGLGVVCRICRLSCAICTVHGPLWQATRRGDCKSPGFIPDAWLSGAASIRPNDMNGYHSRALPQCGAAAGMTDR